MESASVLARGAGTLTESPLTRLTNRMRNSISNVYASLEAQNRTMDRLCGEKPPIAENERTSPREVWPFNGELGELEIAVSSLEDLAVQVQCAVNRVTAVA